MERIITAKVIIFGGPRRKFTVNEVRENLLSLVHSYSVGVILVFDFCVLVLTLSSSY